MIGDALDRLPPGWTETTLGEAFEWGSGGTPSSGVARYYGGDIPWVVIGDLTDGPVTRSETCITQEGLRNSSAKWVEPGSVLIAMYGSIGKLGLASVPLTTNQAIAFTKPHLISARYLFWYLRHCRGLLYSLGKGGTQRNISQTVIKSVPFLLAPLPEQHRIVAAIEEQFTRLDAAVASLERARATFKRYRAAVLAAACSGRLVPTEAELARAEGREYESATQLIDQISPKLNAQSNGRPSSNAISDTDDLPALPEGWSWATWEQLTRRVTVGHVGPMKSEYVATGVPFLRSQNVRENRFEPTGLLYITAKFHAKLSKSRIEPGDLAVVRSGSVGVTCVIPDYLGEANCADLVLIQRPHGVDPRYGSFYMNSLARGAIKAGQVGSALIHFNTRSVAALPIALPPLAEQHRIVTEVERCLSITDELEATIATNLKRAERMRQSILRRAFEGKLVPQDPTDEPATVLLDRLRAGQTARTSARLSGT